MNYKITVLPGDGIGPEITNQAIKVLKAIEHKFNIAFELHSHDFGACAIDKFGVPLTDETLEACKNSDAILLGAIGTPHYDNNPALKIRPEQGLLKLRKELGLYTNIRPIQTYKKLMKASPLKEVKLKGVDFVIYRELTGGIYFGEKSYDETNSTATDICSYSVEEIERIAIQAFEHAMRRKKELMLVDKANVLETSRLWRKVVQRLSAQFPEVTVKYMFIDNAAMQVMLNPAQFDVVLTENMFGDILSDAASAITGSIGMLPSASIGKSTGVFEPIHGSYPEGAGKDIANPMATILSVAMMLEHLNLPKAAKEVRKAVEWALKNNVVTVDINPQTPMSCSVVGDLIAYYIETEEELTVNKDISKFNSDFALG